MAPFASCKLRSCSFSSRVLPGSSRPSRFKKLLKTLVGGALLSSWSGSLGPFQVPSAQNTIFLLMAQASDLADQFRAQLPSLNTCGDHLLVASRKGEQCAVPGAPMRSSNVGVELEES